MILFRWRLCLALFLLIPPLTVSAQTAGTIEGTVLDPTGALVPGAAIRVTESQTSAARTAVTDSQGRYLVLALAPGLYDVEVRGSGFGSQVRRGMEVSAGAVLRADFELQLGSSEQHIEVAASASLVNPSTADWGGLVEQQRLESLPLNGRDLFDLSAQVPGVSVAFSAERSLSTPGIQVSANGARPTQNSFRLDGIYINHAGGGAPASASGALLGLESIRELRIVTNPFSAEYGRLSGAVLAAVSRSGSNQWHGAAYEYLRNSALDARNFFDSPDEKIPPLRRHQFGALISGPVLENQLFFLLNYEGVRESRSETASASVPTAAARQGILPSPDGARVVEVADAMRPYLALYPLPNGADYGDGRGEFISQLSQTTREDYGAAKLDFLATESLRLSGRYTADDADQDVPDPLHIWRHANRSRYQFLHAEAQYIPSPSTIHTARAAFSRTLNANSSITGSDVSNSLSFVAGQGLGSMVVPGLQNFGYVDVLLNPRHFVINDFQFSHAVSRVRGRHTLNVGVGFDRVQFNQLSSRGAVGHYRFSSLADLLQARAASGEVMLPGSDGARGYRQNLFHVFVQDEFRLSAHLILSLGLRWEPTSAPIEVDGKTAYLLDPLHDATVSTGGPVFSNPSRRNLAPRVAIAWDPAGTSHLVVRMGVGVFNDLLGSRELLIAGARMPPFFNRALPAKPEFPNILRAAQTAAPAKAIDGVDYYVQQPRVWRFHFSIERKLSSKTTVEATYTGARGIHLAGNVGNMNPPVPEVTADGELRFPESASAPRLNPAFDQIAMRRTQFNSFYHAFSAGLRGQLAPNLNVQAKYTWGKSIDETSSSIFKEFENSDLLPTMFNYRLNRGLSDFDVRHVFAASISWSLPRGWEVYAMPQARTGHPFSPTVGFDRARLRSGPIEVGQRPDFVPTGQSLVTGDPAGYFDPSAFALPAAGTYGNLGRNVLTGPGLFVLDAAVHKLLWHNEHQQIRLRAEAFNLTNHPNFQIPSGLSLFDGTLNRLGSAGRITSTSTSSRQLQLVVKWVF